jgi:PAS domain S-box-containing protein
MNFDPAENPKILEAILDSLPRALYVLNDKLEIQWVNQTAVECLDKSVSKGSKSRCYKDILRRKTRCEECPTLKTFKSGKVESTEVKKESGGEVRSLLITSVPLGHTLADGRPLVVEMVQDVTPSKKMEEELLRVSDFNSAIIENAPVAIFTIDKKGRFLSVNPALGTISGLGPEAPAKLIQFNWLENPYTISCGLAEYIRKGLNGQPFELWDYPFTTYRGDRSQYIHFRGVPLRRKDGRVDGLLCIIEETTERVRISAQLMQEGKMSAIGRLATAIAHELNNPLATLVAHSELACDLIQGVDDTAASVEQLEELRGYLEVVQEQAFRCKEIVKDLFNLLWREGFEEGLTDINALLREILETKIAMKSDITLTRRFARDLPLAAGETNALRQVLLNILQNAVDALEGRSACEIWVRTSSKDGHVIVEIEDNGVGIPAAIADHIFEPFFTTKKQNKGMGLGLAICRDLITKIGGEISVKPRRRGGTIFRMVLPARKAQELSHG